MPAKRSLTKGQRIELEARQAVLKQVGLGECSQLCDVFQMERVCEGLTEAFYARALGGSSSFGASLEQFLIQPLVGYLGTLNVKPRRVAGVPVRTGQRMEVVPTLGLIEAAERAQRALNAGPWSDAERSATVEALRNAWCQWIAYVASYWITEQVPKLLAAKAARKEQGRLGGTQSKQGEQRSTSTAPKIVELYERLAKTKAAHEVAGAVAVQLGMTPQWVRKVWREHSAAKKAKQ